MRRAALALLLLVATVGLAAMPGLARPVAAPPSELTDKPWLAEIVRHLYRWHLDERDIDPVIKVGTVVCWVRERTPQLDEGDRSRFGEVVLPQFGLLVKVKLTDYTVPELGATVKSDRFRITSVARVGEGIAKPEGAEEVSFPYTELRDHLFKTRKHAAFPEGELLERLRAAVRHQVQKEHERSHRPMPTETQVVYLAPLSPIANEAWVFWETGRTLVHFRSDIDLTHPAMWEHETLNVRLYPLDEKVVVSLDEVAGSNAFMTRDEAGRALFNCIVLGKRVELEPPAAAEQQGGPPPAQPPAQPAAPSAGK